MQLDQGALEVALLVPARRHRGKSLRHAFENGASLRGTSLQRSRERVAGAEQSVMPVKGGIYGVVVHVVI